MPSPPTKGEKASFLAIPSSTQRTQSLGGIRPSASSTEITFAESGSAERRFTWNDIVSFMKNKNHNYREGRVETILEFRTGPEKWCLYVTLLFVVLVIVAFIGIGFYKGYIFDK